MITTVTTVTSITTITALGITGAISIAAAITLILLLSTKELAGTTGSSTPLRIAKFISIGIVPLVMAFAVIVGVKIAEVIA